MKSTSVFTLAALASFAIGGNNAFAESTLRVGGNPALIDGLYKPMQEQLATDTGINLELVPLSSPVQSWHELASDKIDVAAETLSYLRWRLDAIGFNEKDMTYTGSLDYRPFNEGGMMWKNTSDKQAKIQALYFFVCSSENKSKFQCASAPE